MRLFEIASAQEQMALWRLISDNTWAAIEQQAREEAARKAEEQRRRSVRPKRSAKAKAKGTAPKTAVPSPAPDEEAATAQADEKSQDKEPVATNAVDDKGQAAQEQGSEEQQQNQDTQEPQAAGVTALPAPNQRTPMPRQPGGFQVAQKPIQKTKSPVL